MSQFTWANPVRTGSDDGPTIAERTHTPDPAAVERLKRLMAEQAAERERRRQDDAAAKARAGLRARLLARAKAAREADGEASVVVEAPARPKPRPVQAARHKPLPRLTEDAVRALHARNMAGETLKSLAAEVGLHSCTLSDYLKRYGLHGRHQKLCVTDEEEAAAFADHAAGKSWEEIANAMGISTKALRLLRQRKGQGDTPGGARLNSSVRRFDDACIRALHARYMDGESLATLGAEVQLDPSALRRRFSRLELSLVVRQRGPAAFTLTPEQRDEVVAARGAGQSWDAIAAGMGCSRKTLALAVGRAGHSTAEFPGRTKNHSGAEEAAAVAAAVVAHAAGQRWDEIAAHLGWRRQTLVIAVRQAGYDTGNRQPRSPLVEDAWDEIVAERLAGRRLEEIAARRGMDRRALSRGLKQRGVGVKRAVQLVIQIDEDVVRGLHARHMAGESIRVLAEEVGVSYTTLVRRFRRLGLARVGGARPHWFPEEKLAAAVAAHAAGQPWGIVAAEYGVSAPTLMKAIRRAGYDTGRVVSQSVIKEE